MFAVGVGVYFGDPMDANARLLSNIDSHGWQPDDVYGINEDELHHLAYIEKSCFCDSCKSLQNVYMLSAGSDIRQLAQNILELSSRGVHRLGII